MIPSPRTKTAASAAVAEEPFYIPATASPSRPRRVLKHGDSFAVVDSHGDIGTQSRGTKGQGLASLAFLFFTQFD